METYILDFLKTSMSESDSLKMLNVVDDIVNSKERNYIVVLEGKTGSGKTFLVNFLSTMIGKLHFYSFNNSIDSKLIDDLDPKAIHVLSTDERLDITDDFSQLLKRAIDKGITIVLQTEDINLNYILLGRGFNVRKFKVQYNPILTS